MFIELLNYKAALLLDLDWPLLVWLTNQDKVKVLLNEP
jgi:hypothetical protein